MARRRNVYNPLDPTPARRWQVVRSVQGTVIESQELPAGADLKRIFITSMLKHLDAGWQVGEFSSNSGTFFCTLGLERRMVSIDPTDPHDVPMYGAAHLASRD